MTRLLLLLAAGLLGGCGLLGFGDDDEGPQPTPLKELSPRLTVTQLWSTSCGSGVESPGVTLTLASDGERLFCAAEEGTVAAHALADGKRLWSVDTDLPLSGGPGSGGGSVLVGTASAELLVLDAADGRELWRSKTSSQVLSAPAAGGGIAVVHSADGRLAAHDAGNGQRLWFYDSGVPALTSHGTSPPRLVAGVVLAGFANGKLAAFDGRDGRQLWETTIALPRGRSELDRMVDVDAAPVVVRDTVFAVAYQGRVAALSLRTGTLLWARDMSSTTGLDVAGGRLFVSDSDDVLWGLDGNGGAAYWQQADFKLRRLTAPAVVGDTVVVGDFEGYLHFIDAADGAEVARVRVGDDPLLAPPLAIGDTVYALGAGGALAAVRVGG